MVPVNFDFFFILKIASPILIETNYIPFTFVQNCSSNLEILYLKEKCKGAITQFFSNRVQWSRILRLDYMW